jgi:hypothetical protein
MAMRTRRRARVRRAARRLVERLGFGLAWGTESVSLGSLVSPLRYDILVRGEYFEWLALHREVLDDPPRLIELSRSEPYFKWFAGVVVPRFRPHLASDPDGLLEAFGDRVMRSVSLLRSVEESGFDPNQPLTLETGRRIQPTATGKRLARRLYPGDGCHRLALRMARGETVLEPGSYRIRTVLRFEPLDNTAPLLKELAVTRSAYREFLELSYGSLVHKALPDGEPSPPSEPDDGPLAEIRAVAEVDQPLLRT